MLLDIAKDPPSEPAHFKLVTHRAETMLISSFPGPVGFQSNNIAMAKGMFTSIGMVLESFHSATPSQKEALWGMQASVPIFGDRAEHRLSPALSLLSFLKLDTNGYHTLTPSSLCPYPLFSCFVLDHLM